MLSTHAPRSKTTRALALLLALLFAWTLGGCGEETVVIIDKERKAEIEEDSDRIREDVLLSFTEEARGRTQLEAIRDFADAHEIYYRSVDDKTLILIKKADPQAPKAQDLSLQCSLRPEDPEGSALCASALLSLLLSCNDHRRVTGIFTLEETEFPQSAQALSKEYLDTDMLISLLPDGKTGLYNSSPEVSLHRFEKAGKKVSLGERKGYRIQIECPPESLPREKDAEYCDPLQILYDLLSWCESSHLDYRVVSFTAGEEGAALPVSGELVIFINASDNAKFQNKLHLTIQEFSDTYGSINEGYRFSRVSEEEAKKGLAPEDMTAFLGLVYLLQENFDYVGQSEEEADAGLHLLNHVDLAADHMRLDVLCRYKSGETPEQASIFTELAALSDFETESIEILPYLDLDKETPLRERFLVAAEEQSLGLKNKGGYTLLDSACFRKKNKDLPLLSLGADPDHYHELVCTLVQLVETPDPEE